MTPIITGTQTRETVETSTNWNLLSKIMELGVTEEGVLPLFLIRMGCHNETPNLVPYVYYMELI